MIYWVGISEDGRNIKINGLMDLIKALESNRGVQLSYWCCEMMCFDELPPKIRQKLANANHCYSPSEMLTFLERGWTTDQILAFIDKAESKKSP